MNNNTSWLTDRFLLYQNANSSPEAVKRNFLIRIAEFELIIADLRSKKQGDPLQHELILGRRGSGKSTLLRRIQIEIDEQKDLSDKYIAVNLAEEQNAIYRLSDLWFEVLQELCIRLKVDPDLESFDTFKNNQDYTRYLYDQIHQLLQQAGKQVVLLLDNLDRIVENFDDDAHLFRETLLNYADVQIIGGSTRMNEHFWRYDQPFYDFFRRHRLEGLSFEEIHRLLNHWSREMELPDLQDYALRHPGRVEAIRILTDGLPRALQYFIQVLLHDSDLYGFDYLKNVMDKATPLYQERLHNLTAAHRKIVQEMAFCWEAVPTKILVEKCRMESKLIASYLKQLDQYGIIQTISTGKKNHLYRLAERFFNMWLIVTQGAPDQKRRARYLTVFLESWYDEQELQLLAQDHLSDLANKKYSFDKAIAISKGLAQSRFIGVKERDALIEHTLALKPEDQEDFDLPRKFSEIAAESERLFKNGQYEKSLAKYQEIENEEDGVKFFMLARCYNKLGHERDAERFYKKAVEKNHAGAMNNLANLYKKQGAFSRAEKLYLDAIEQGNAKGLYNLGNLYKILGRQQEAERYYLNAIEQGHTDAMINLGNLYKVQEKFEDSEKYYRLAAENGKSEVFHYLAVLYQQLGRNDEAELFYQKAVEGGVQAAMVNFAAFYFAQNRNAAQALDLMRRYQSLTHDEAWLGNLILMELWNGVFEDLDQKIDHFLEFTLADDGIQDFFLNLLYLGQIQLVRRLFESEKYGKKLREQYALIHWAVLILSGNADENLQLRIPPEVLPTVEEIVKTVRERQM